MKQLYHLPPEKIAQRPPAERGESRLLVVDRRSGELSDRYYADVVEYVQPGDVLVVNDTKVLPARLLAHFPDGRERELMLTERHAAALPENEAIVVYRGKLRVGDELQVGHGSVRIIELIDGGQARIKADKPIEELAQAYGHTPLPPYVRREDDASDRERYQTVFARDTGSVAAPTASLNLTDELLQQIRDKGVKVMPLTLHVGRGTFLPIRTEDIEQHAMHEEYFEIPAETVEVLRQARTAGKHIIAVGTTVTRALEYAADDILGDKTGSISGEANIFIYPGYQFRVVDRLLTNFHAPDSTVIQLAAAFAGEHLLKQSYQHALAHGYKFLSYGDSMLIV